MSDATASMLADSIARAVADHPVPDPWAPGSAVDDSDSPEAAELDRALGQIGWASLVEEGAEPPVLAGAATALGREVASLRHLDAVLGGSPVVAGLTRHARVGATAFEVLAGDCLREVEIVSLEPVGYGDASGVARVVNSRPVAEVPAEAARRRLEAWRAVSIGYLAGLAAGAFDACLEHVRGRQAFGATLDANASVQARLAEAATALEGARLLVEHECSWPALSHASAVAVEVTAACHQLTGALGYTMEYPLQRRSRRARAMRSWAEWAADAATAHAMEEP